MTERMRVLGIDPGSHKTGWGVIDVNERGKVIHVDNGVLFLDDDRDLSIRLVDLCHRLRDVARAQQPTLAAMEDIFVHKGARSALILGQARGAAMATLGLLGIRTHNISTSLVKSRVAGRGRAGKGQVAEMVRVLLSLPEVPFEDAADALAVALAAVPSLQSPPLVLPSARPVGKRNSTRNSKSARSALFALARAQGKA